MIDCGMQLNLFMNKKIPDPYRRSRCKACGVAKGYHLASCPNFTPPSLTFTGWLFTLFIIFIFIPIALIVLGIEKIKEAI